METLDGIKETPLFPGNMFGNRWFSANKNYILCDGDHGSMVRAVSFKSRDPGF